MACVVSFFCVLKTPVALETAVICKGLRLLNDVINPESI